MLDTMTRYLGAVKLIPMRRALRFVFSPLCDRSSSQSIRTAGLNIAAGASPLARISASADYYATANGVLVTVAAGTNMPALTGINVSAAFFNVACFFIDSASVVTVAGGTQAATLGGVVFPQFPEKKALVGFLILPGAFTGGTTALDAVATVFINPLGSFDPTVLI